MTDIRIVVPLVGISWKRAGQSRPLYIKKFCIYYEHGSLSCMLKTFVVYCM